MQIIHGLNEMSSALPASVLTVGNFDGLHRGHRTLIAQVIETSKQLGIPSVVLTFYPHPSRVLRPAAPVPQLFSRQDLERELQKMGVQVLVIEPFTHELAQTRAEDYVEQNLWPKLHPRAMIVGHDFVLGRDRLGTFDVLQKLSLQLGFRLARFSPVEVDGAIISSSKIRQALLFGDVEAAARDLARPYYIEGCVVAGEGRGDKLGFATANLKTDAEVILLPGVYLTHFQVGEDIYPSVTNVGHKPTFHKQHELTVETHVLGLKKSFYGQSVKVIFLKRIRAELKFSSAHELIKQISEDVSHAKKFFKIEK